MRAVRGLDPLMLFIPKWTEITQPASEGKLCVAVQRRERWFGTLQNNAWLHKAFTSALNKTFIPGLTLGETNCKVPIAAVVLSTFLHRFVLSRVMWCGCKHASSHLSAGAHFLLLDVGHYEPKLLPSGCFMKNERPRKLDWLKGKACLAQMQLTQETRVLNK